MLRSVLSTCTFAFGVPRALWHPAVPSFRSARRKSTIVEIVGPCPPNFAGRRRRLCVYTAVTKTGILVEESGKTDSSVDGFEDELDSMELMSEDDDADGRCNDDPPQSRPARPSLLESNIGILEHDCVVGERVREAARSRAGILYLGLDISAFKTGYAVLTPMSPGSGSCAEKELRVCTRAELVEWGCIAGSAAGSKSKDVMDVGEAVEKGLVEVVERCASLRNRREPVALDNKAAEKDAGEVRLSEQGGEGRSQAEKVAADGATWVVGVEDFMRRFLPGKSSARSMFTLAQLNGIVKYVCRKHLGARPESVHPSRARSFYGLLLNRPEGKDMKQIVLEFALAQEPEGLETRHDGSGPEGSYDMSDAYLVASYSWHQDLLRAMTNNREIKSRFVASFRELHADKLATAEEKAVAMFMSGDMPAAKGKKKLKPLTEREARQAHRKMENARLSKAFETALLHWFKDRVLGLPR